MDQAIVIDDDIAIIMIEDDDRDEVVILERAPSMSPIHFSNAEIRNRTSRPNTREHFTGSTLRSQFDNSPAPGHSVNLPSIDLTTAVASRSTKPKESNSPGDRVCSVSTSLPGFIIQEEGYESSRPWNIAAEARTDQGTSQDRIRLSRRRGTKEGTFSPRNEMVANSRNTSHTHSMPERRSSNASLMSISDKGGGDEEKTSTTQDMTSHTFDNAVIIEDSDDFEFKLESQLLEKPEFEFLRSVSVSEKPKLKVVPLRNPPIASPYFECETYLCGKHTLRPAKTVELEDGDFIYIKHIVKYIKPEDIRGLSLDNTQNASITIRGFRLQRCKYLNGMLEKKMNEVCLCYEIDLDDPRAPEEQSLVEVPLSSVKTLRSLRWTNYSYPKYRNLNRDATWTDGDTYIKGGLTVRWKYTCKYVSASAREKNIYAERTLERITEGWLSSIHQSTQSHLASSIQLRIEWRGETVPGGTYIPECYDVDGEEKATEVQQPQNPAVVEDTESPPETFIIVDEDDDDDDDDDDSASSPARPQQYEAGVVQTKRKSDFSSSSDRDSDQEDNKPAKRARQVPEDDIEQIRQRLGRVKLTFNGKEYVKQSYNIGTLSEMVLKSEPKSKLTSTQQIRDTNRPAGGLRSNRGVRPRLRGRLTLPRRSALNSRGPYPEASIPLPSCPAPSPKIPPHLEISSSELASPPPSGIVDLSSHQSRASSLISAHSSRPPSLKEALVLAPEQTFTYGDAFCGAGGTTRGAVMAGLRVKWGFDFDQHACTTWRLNFPGATCYEMSSERFVSLATSSPYSSDIPNDVKVDILHLSPPCQYFSPAHTVEGKNDEMNTASLFAVAAVIKVAKPRIVTLEQTFGILYPRFRGYFSSLVCMFTSCGFSLRWAIVPLAQWGLPQRRFRLIIIASCPGEPLPPMPPPTHFQTPSPLSPLHKTRPFKTVSQTLREIPKSAANHSPHLLPEKDLKPYNPHAILPRTMTTSGGDNWHPSGKRGFTDREFACLQGFPLEHKFGQNGIKRQIGNAVPPVVAKVLFEGIRRFMEGTDGVVRDEGDENGGENGYGEVDDKMDICEDIDMDRVHIEDSDDRVEIVDLVDESDDMD
ncbi:putative c-5 cytosine methyltransferase protein [Botrytis fragariae]|uniref:DNA (cytosine-5-)-methyltransferase n=1 Tax=Botrytis fragariae TaxID=1964551 RepID=A0A8H6EI59_9HELO|nr:putative c-5 cytosine methyltransferase protein [Botrytis fragariae]KAF5873123.1 putative c-5 cytosine methyltransferase protein [Botrytis fragariae]